MRAIRPQTNVPESIPQLGVIFEFEFVVWSRLVSRCFLQVLQLIFLQQSQNPIHSERTVTPSFMPDIVVRPTERPTVHQTESGFIPREARAEGPSVARLINLSGRAGPSGAKPREFERKIYLYIYMCICLYR